MTRKTPGRHFRKGISLMEITAYPNNEGAGLWPVPLVSDRSGAVRRDAGWGRVGQQVSELTVEELSGGSVPPYNAVEAGRWS